MFRSLYAKLMAVFCAVLLMAMTLLSGLLYQRIRDDKIDARLKELVVQAEDLAYFAAQLNTIASFGTQQYLVWKCQKVMQEYDAVVLLVDRNNRVIPISDDQITISSDISEEDIVSLVTRVASGEVVKEPLFLQDNPNPVFAVGVPYLENGRRLGAVFIFTSEQNVESSYRDILLSGLRAMLITLFLGAFLILVVSRLIARPLKDMARAAEKLARGDFERRVSVESRDEVGLLAEAFNSMAEDLGRLEQTRREFVANVSHELRSPLTSIQGFLTGMQDGTVPEEDRERYLSIVVEETKRLNRLITELLDLSRIESGQTELHQTEFDLNERVARVLIRQESRITEKNLDIQLDFESDTCRVRADADRIEQVLINLIDNAIKYGGEGCTVRVSTRRERDMVRVAVQDNGPGIAAEDLPCVFERFYKADKAHTTGNGTGLGLAIAKKIVEQHGQKITVKSAPGQGARFEFTLEGA